MPFSQQEVPVVAFGDELSVVPADSAPVAATLDTTISSTSGSVDNSTLNAFPPIKNQGSQGSCGAFSSTYYQMTHMTALARGWNAKTGGDSTHFSPKWTYNMMNGGGDNGTFIDDNLSMMRDHGCALWSDFPYTGLTSDVLPWCLTASVWSNAISYRMNDFSTLTSLYTSNGLAALKAVLDNGYVVTFDTYSPWSYGGWVQGAVGNDPATTNDNAFVGQQICKYVRAQDWGHAMTIVGYNDNIWCDLNTNGVVDAGEKGALKIANSWGTWANSGYAWFSYDALKTDSAVAGWNPSDKVYGFGYGDSAASCIAYVITARSSYNPRFLARFTINHAQRSMISLSVGRDTTSVTNSPSTSWTPTGLSYCGGTYAFNGTSTACDGTFFLDLSSVVTDPSLLRRYFIGLTSLSGTAQLKSFVLSDTVTGEQMVITPTNAPAAMSPASGTIGIGSAWAWADMGAPSATESNSAATNATTITIKDNASATPYPASITVSGMATNPIKVTVSLKGLTHTYPSDMNALLVSPAGQKIILMTTAGGADSISDLTVTFDDTADTAISSSETMQSRSYKPTDNSTSYALNSPAPKRPYGTSLAVLTNENPNGIWKLFVTDNSGGDAGTISGGWRLTFSYPTPPSAWLSWATNAFTPLQLAVSSVTAPMGDPDHDGYCNMLEYAFNSNPCTNSSTPSPVTVGMEVIGGILTPVFSYPRRSGAGDITYTEELSTNLVSWSSNQTTILQSISDSKGTMETVTTKPSSPSPAAKPVFFRVRVSM